MLSKGGRGVDTGLGTSNSPPEKDGPCPPPKSKFLLLRQVGIAYGHICGQSLTVKALGRIRFLIVSMSDCPGVWRGISLFILPFKTQYKG